MSGGSVEGGEGEGLKEDAMGGRAGEDKEDESTHQVTKGLWRVKKNCNGTTNNNKNTSKQYAKWSRA